MTDTILIERDGPVTIVVHHRPERRNAVDGATARKLFDAFLAFDADHDAWVAVFTGTGGYFCAGADLKAVATGDPDKKREFGGHGSIAPMGRPAAPDKPVIAAVEGFAVAGGMELALWAHLRVVAEDATFGILPPLWRAADRSRHHQAAAADRPFTGHRSDSHRPPGRRGGKHCAWVLPTVSCPKARRAHTRLRSPERSPLPANLHARRRVVRVAAMGLREEDAIANEMRGGLEVIASGEMLSGAKRFASGAGRASSPAIHMG